MRALALPGIISAVLFLVGCGFHLRDSDTAPWTQDISPLTITVTDQGDPLAIERLAEHLQAHGIILSDTSDEGWQLVLSDFFQRDNQTAIGGDEKNDIRELELVDGYRLSLFKDGQAYGSTDIQHRTTVSYASAQFIGSEEEARNAHRQLAEENARAAFRFIQAIIHNLPPSS